MTDVAACTSGHRLVIGGEPSGKESAPVYLLKESLAGILDGKQVHVARRKLGEWIGWAFRSQLAPFRRLAATIRDQPRTGEEPLFTGRRPPWHPRPEG